MPVTSPSGQTYQFSAVSATGSLTATYAINTYTITVNQGANGTISPGTTTVNCGGSQTFTITPNNGYSINQFIIGGQNQGAIASYSFTNVQASYTISASFTAQSIIFQDGFESGDISAWTGTNTSSGTLTVSTTRVHDGTYAAQGVVSSNSGWAVVYEDIASASTVYWSGWLWIDSQNIPSGNTAKFMEMLNGWNPVARVGVTNNNGTLNWALSYGDGNGNETFANSNSTLSLQTWYFVEAAAYANATAGWTQLWINGTSVKNNINVNTGSAINRIDVGASDFVVTAYIDSVESASSFISQSTYYTISASAGSGGSISPSGSVQVAANGNQTFTITPNNGYSISQVTVDNQSQGAINSYTFTSVEATHVISAAFTAIQTIFQDDFENGNFNAWTGTNTQNGTISASTTRAHNGTYSAKGVVNSNGGWAVVYEDIASTSTVYWSGWVWIDSQNIPSSSIAKFMEILNGWNPVARFGVKNSSGTLKWALSYGDGTGNETFVSSTGSASLQTWYYVEIAANANSTTGWTQLWVNGTSMITNQNVNTGSTINRIDVGASDAITTAYIDTVTAAPNYV